jgi:hypothetical protein
VERVHAVLDDADCHGLYVSTDGVGEYCGLNQPGEGVDGHAYPGTVERQ